MFWPQQRSHVCPACWRLGDKNRTETALQDWVGQRAQAGRLPPRGFPSSNKLG